MNKIALILFALVFSSVIAHAEVYVVHKNGEIYSLSEKNDAVVPSGYEVKIIKGAIEDIGLTRPVEEYQFKGGKFVPNSKKIKDKEDAQIALQQRDAERAANRASGIEKLKAQGLTEDEINALVGR